MRLGIDLRALQSAHQRRGIGRYTANLLPHLGTVSEDDMWLFHLEGLAGLNGETEQQHFHAAPVSLPWGLRATSVRLSAGVLLPWRAWRLGMEVMLFPQGVGAEPVCVIPTRLSCPFVVVVHDLIPLLFPQHYPRFAASPVYRAQCQLLTAAAGIIADSESTRKDVCSLLGVQPPLVKVVHPGASAVFSPVEDIAELSRVWTNVGVTPPYFLTVGGYDWRKNLPTTLRAFARVKEKSRNGYGMVVVEERMACPEGTEALIEQLGIAEQVVFTGAVSDLDLRALYSGALALVFPSRYEGFGLPVVEAMACGTPVICSRAGSLPEVAWEAALYVDPEDGEGLAANMLRLTEEPELCRKLSAEGRARAAQFSWPVAAAEILAVCRQAAGVSDPVPA